MSKYSQTSKIWTPKIPQDTGHRAADLPYFMLVLQKLWAVQWPWPITAYVFILFSAIRSYGHPLIPRRPDKRGLTVQQENGCLTRSSAYRQVSHIQQIVTLKVSSEISPSRNGVCPLFYNTLLDFYSHTNPRWLDGQYHQGQVDLTIYN